VELDSRKGLILQAVVTDYVETAEPIGSEWLAAHYDFGCKSATLRNEMAEMAEWGYLVQPHTSAGRIPSHLGYRYYVDRLMPAPSLPESEERRALSACERMRTEVAELVLLTCRLLADMTQYPSVATPPVLDVARLHRLFVTLAGPRHVLVVLLLSTGHVEHRLFEVDSPPSEASLQRVTNYLNDNLAGCELDDITHSVPGEIPPELAGERALLRMIYAGIAGAARALTEDRVFVEGTSQLLRQREFQNVLRLEQLLTALQQRSVLSKVFRRTQPDQDVTVIIGSESKVEAMQDCSTVTSRYVIRDRTGGYIGVVGPTRMNYDRAVAAVGLMARSLSAVLTRVCLG
jgi:heat-inducible transcriptional repressor